MVLSALGSNNPCCKRPEHDTVNNADAQHRGMDKCIRHTAWSTTPTHDTGSKRCTAGGRVVRP
eukprot:3159927-Heterocapsa_arctica.AAC.1